MGPVKGNCLIVFYTGIRTSKNTDGTTMTEYWVDGKLHREDGPAVIYSDGYKEWWLNDVPVSAQEVFDRLTDEEKNEVIWNMDEWR